ncbi:MAG: hypothetical protein K9L70_05460 [Thiohalocapsa sp.]|nr:hypothetical protein [Thiohalocapsa sp.]MCF7992800.1 hypothetical protein [Thiohalocapsa sp.]
MNSQTLISAIAAALIAGSLSLPGSALAGERYRDGHHYGHHDGERHCSSPRKHHPIRDSKRKNIVERHRGPVYVPIWPQGRGYDKAYRGDEGYRYRKYSRRDEDHRDWRISYRDRRD